MIKLIAFLRNNPSTPRAVVANQFDIDKSTVTKYRKNGAAIEQKIIQSNLILTKKNIYPQDSQLALVFKALLILFHHIRNVYPNISISVKHLLNQANQLYFGFNPESIPSFFQEDVDSQQKGFYICVHLFSSLL
jgi:hypothetical protein